MSRHIAAELCYREQNKDFMPFGSTKCKKEINNTKVGLTLPSNKDISKKTFWLKITLKKGPVRCIILEG